MKLENPKTKEQRTYAVFRDARNGKSKSLTVYGVTPDEAARFFRRAVKQQADNEARDRQTA